MSIPGAASPLFLATTAGAAGDFSIPRSLRFNSGDSAYLSRDVSSASNRKTFTWSGWVKRGNSDADHHLFVADKASSDSLADNTFNRFYILASGQLQFSGYNTGYRRTIALLRDPAAFYHLVLAVDTTQATADDRIKIYINGTQVANADFELKNNPSQNYDLAINNSNVHAIGARSRSGSLGFYFDGYLTEINFVDGSQLDHLSFGAFDDNGVWQAKDTSGLTFGTNGFRLKFADNSGATATTLGKDTSGNSNNWTPNNLSVSGGSLNKTRGHNYDDTAATYTDLGTVSQATPGSTPTGNSAHYEGAAMRVNSGGAKVVTTNSAAADFFMACWVRLDSLVSGHQMGVDLDVDYKYFEVRSDGRVKVRHNSPGGANTSGSSHLSNNTWQHIALSRSGNTLTGFVNGSAVVNTNCGNATYSISANEDFFFFGIGSSTTGYLVDAVIYIGEGRTTNFTAPSAPLLTSTAGINNVGGMSTSNRYYASSLIAVGAGNEGIDSLVDSPTNGTASTGGDAGGVTVGNYATFNPINSNTHSAYYTLSNGNLKCVAVGGQNQSSGNRGFCVSTIGMSSGKYYFELTVDLNDNNDHAVGIAKAAATGYYSTAGNWTYQATGQKFANSGGGNSYGASYTAGDIIGVAFDADTGALVCYKNGSSQGTLATVTVGETYFFVWGIDAGTAQDYEVSANFGQRAFAYPLSGYKALCTSNLPEPTIADGSKYFDTKLYTGNGGTQTLSGLGFSPDMVWFKNRTSAVNHHLLDTVRGANNGANVLYPNLTNAEGANSSLTAFTSDGFTVGSNDSVNKNNNAIAAWAWDGGTSTVTNNDGSIASQVRVNQTAGFSIVTYTGVSGNQSFGHGLNVKPKFIAIKNRSNSANWFAMFDTGATHYQYGHLNDTTAFAAATAQPVTNSTITYGNNNSWFGAAGDNYLALCFAPVEGYSAIGTYQGNGNADGSFVFTGFKIAYLVIKCSSHSSMWSVWDATRDVDNPSEHRIRLDEYRAEESGDSNIYIDLLSNGFKTRAADTDTNGSSRTYVYVAFASNPFQANGGLAR